MASRAKIPLLVTRVVDDKLEPVSGITVVAKDRATTNPASIYAAETGVGLQSPAVTDANGHTPGWCDRGEYILEYSLDGGATTTQFYWDSAPAEDGAIDSGWIGTGAVQAADVANSTWSTVLGVGAARPAAAAGNAGYWYYDTATNELSASNGTTWTDLPFPSAPFRTERPIGVGGTLTAGMNIPVYWASKATGQTINLVKARHKIRTGTSISVTLNRNGAAVTGYTGLSVTTTATDTAPAPVAISDNDEFSLTLASPSGTPQDLTFQLVFEHTF